jgi:hypothetical protein
MIRCASKSKSKSKITFENICTKSAMSEKDMLIQQRMDRIAGLERLVEQQKLCPYYCFHALAG